MTADAKRVLILGHGAMGHAFEALLSAAHDVRVWDRDLVTGVETEPLEQAASGRDVVVFALPTQPHDELAGRLRTCLGEASVCVSIAKGLDSQGRTAADVLARQFGGEIDWALIYGPTLAHELRSRQDGFAVVASTRADVAQRVKALFEGARLHLQPCTDPLGAAWAAALKNVYVPLIGAADGLGLGDNLRGFLFAEALDEMAAIIEHLGGRRDTAFGLAGLADLVASATSATSHHRRIGAELAAGRHEAVAASGGNIRTEGVHTVAMIRRHAVFDWRRFALFSLVCEFVDRPDGLADRIGDYIARRFAVAPAG